RAFLQAPHFIDNAFIRSKPDRITEEAGDRTEVATIGTAASGLNRNHVETGRLDSDPPHQISSPPRQMTNQIELFQVHVFPRYGRIVVEAGFDSFTAAI